MKSSRFDDLKKIYLLKTLVEQGNLNKSAQIHKITASAVSQSIKALELSLGYPVIVKTQDSWKLTEKGDLLLRQAEKVFSVLEENFVDKNQDQFHLASLSVGAYESLALELIKDLSTQIRADFPDVRLNFQISRSPELIKKIQSGELCSAIISQTDFLPTDFLIAPLFEDYLGLYASPHLGIKDISDIKNHLVGMISAGSEGYPQYFKKFLKKIPDLKANLLCDSYEVLRDLAENSEAVVLLPSRVASKAQKTLQEIKISEDAQAGKHQIILIASGTCDRREFDYIAQLLK